MESPKVIARSKPDAVAAVSLLHNLRLWDAVSAEDRKSFIEKGEILDTNGGKLIFDTLSKIYEKSKAR